ncbi:MAG: hypothetical protein KatS3mg076_2826 [Candidatus Binatia bacterium]|nr:MAG: hypothetical protein KatS3mg076_2826 [Candidatus Binatia bacterium]
MRKVSTLLALAASVTLAAGVDGAEMLRLQDKEGKSYGVVVDCRQPDAEPDRKKYFGGAEEGFLGKEPCGKCLVEANWGVLLKYPYDLMIKGTLLDEEGKPVENKLVHFFFPNGWIVKTRTTKSGFFRILMGATDEKKSDRWLEMDVGERYVRKGDDLPYYALYVMPEDFRPCGSPKKAAEDGKN